MNGLLPSLGAVALFLAAGLGLAELVPSIRRLPWLCRLGWAYLLGLAGLAGTLYALSHVCGVPLRRPAILATTAALIALGLFARWWHGRRPAVPRRPLSGWIEIGGTALLAFIGLGLFADAVTDPVTGWDARMTWGVQALWVQDAGTVDAPVLQRRNLYVNHPRYPLLLPVAQVAVLEAFDVPPDLHAWRTLYTTCFAAFLAILWEAGRRWAGRRPALCAALAAAGVPALTFFEDSGAASGYSDLPLGCFYGAGLLLLLTGRRRIGDALGAGLLLAGAALTKNEGALLAVGALGLAAALAFALRRRRRLLLRVAAAALPVVLALLLLASWRAGIPNRQDERYDLLVATEAAWSGAITRIPHLAALAVQQMIRFDHWTLFWIAVPVVFGVGRHGWRGRRAPLALALAAAALAPPGIGWGAYLIHPHPDTLVPVTWTRFLIQGSLPLFVLLALALRGVLGRESQGP